MGHCGTCDSFERESYRDTKGYCTYHRKEVGVNDSWSCYSGSENDNKDDDDE